MPKISSGYYGQVQITDFIFDETVTYIAAKQGLEKAVKVGKMLLERIDIVQVDAENFNNSWNIFEKQHDSHLSFTDCTNVATMKAFGITRIATFDHDFKSVSDISIIDWGGISRAEKVIAFPSNIVLP